MTLQVEKVKDWKRAEVEKVADLARRYRVMAAATLYKVRAAQIQELRKRFRGEIIFRCSKANFVNRALEKVAAERPQIEKLAGYIPGSNVYIYTNLDPFKLSLLFQKSKIMMPAKAGDIAQSDIVITEGNTGMAPGPIISEFTEMKVPTKIESGSIWITEDTPVVEKGEAVSAKMASLLSKLGMKPIEAGVDLYVAYEGGLIYPQELLRINLQETMANLQRAALEAFNLALSAAYPTPETLPTLLGRAVLESTGLAVAGVDFGKGTMPLLLGKCYGEMSALLDRLKAKDSTLAS